MVKKKSVKKRRPRSKRPKKKNNLKGELIKTVSGLIALVLVVVGAGILIRYSLVRQPADPAAENAVARTPVSIPEKKARVHKVPIRPKPDHRPPRFEVFPDKELPHYKPQAPLPVPVPQKNVKVAIIIDDLGYDSAIANKFTGLDAKLTFSVLPFSPFHKKIAARARARGHDVMLHLPMEPLEYPNVDPGPGALLMAMSPDELIRRLQEDLDSMPLIKGVNNHMGSRMTAASDRMNQVFSVLKQRGLFFIDSRTTAETVSIQSARMFHVPFAQRDVFLDHVQDPAYIRRQFEKLIHYAESHGAAVGIGHPHRATYEVLRELLPELKRKVELVPASHIVHRSG